ncbi:cytochrome c oxidase subunit CcoM [Marinobacter sp.]
MFTDVVVIAGILTVLLMIGFFVGVGIFIMKDQKNHDDKPGRAKQGGHTG